MRLIIGSSAVSDQPDDAAVRAAIRRLLDKGEDDDAFVVLIDGPIPEDSQYYLQTLFCPPDSRWEDDTYGFVLEYREGSSDQHYQCFTVSPGARGLEEVTGAFIAYLHADNAWKIRFEWEHSPGF